MTTDTPYPPPDPAAEPRPSGFDPQQLGFTPQRPVAWLAPIQLSRTAVQVVMSELFGAYLDKRELQNALPSMVTAEGVAEGELWFDFVADLGDGFDSTYTIAYLLAQDDLAVGGERLPRGRMLMMGGDEVYPAASGQRYEDRTKGPYQAAMPVPPPGVRQPTLYALPGNHDWYDGLTAFIRLFAKAGKGQIGGWRNEQSRSYFAIELPHRWWLFAVDTQFGAYIDDPQLTYFREAAGRLRPGDRIIVCSPTPGWVEAVEDPGAYDTIDYFVRTIIEPTGAEIKLMLSGDLHHYAHYAEADPAVGKPNATAGDGTPAAATGGGQAAGGGAAPADGPVDGRRHLVHCGGGGAYLYPTHKLPETIEVPPPASLVRKPTPTRPYTLSARFPTRSESLRYALGVFGRLPAGNPSFAVLLGALHMLFMLGVVDIMRRAQGMAQHLVTIPVALMGLIILLSATFFAVPPTAGKRQPKHWCFGVGHGVVQLGLGVLGSWGWSHLPFVTWVWPLPLLAALVIYLPVAGLASTELVCLYLLVASNFLVNLNELFAGQSIIDSKSFLRLHIGPDGTLTIYPIAVDRVCRRWTARPEAPPAAPWFEPAEPLATKLAEPPIRIR